MTKAEQSKLNATANALRAVLAHHATLPFEQQAPDIVMQARAVLVTLEAEPVKRQRAHHWLFFYQAAMGLRMVDDSWGWPLAADVEDRTWKRGKLILSAGGHSQCQAWSAAA